MLVTVSWWPCIARPSERSLVHPEEWTHPSDGVAVMRSGIRLGAAVVKLPAVEADLTSVLGPPDRRESLHNRILVWDQLGIFAYQKPDTDVIDTIAVSFRCSELSFCPKVSYAGVLVVGEAVFWSAAKALDMVRYGFKSDDISCFRNLGKYQVSVDCVTGEAGLGIFEIELKK